MEARDGRPAALNAMVAMPSDETSQAAVVRFLCNPASHNGLPVERISTHAAHIFLVGDYAYKLKRAVSLSFLDFSTADKRRAMLEAELRLNKPTAPTLYLEVRPVYNNGPGGAGFGGSGVPIDWVLVMRRFPQEALFDNLARRGALSEPMIDSVAESIARLHREAPVIREKISHPFRRMALDNIEILRSAPVHQSAVAATERALRVQLDALTDHLDKRAMNGFVRRCHGDLHLGNIVLLDGTPAPFDALEFDEALATGDTYYDLAFVLMDLEHHALRNLSNRLLNRYVAITGDTEGLVALRLFMAVRALVRAKVAAIAGAQAGQQEHLARAASYLTRAASLLEPTSPRLIAIGGLSGTGKSALAARLAPQVGPPPGAVVLRSDTTRKRLSGVGETERLSAAWYTAQASIRVYVTLLKDARHALAAGLSVIIDAVFSKTAERQEIELFGREASVPFVGIWLDAPLQLRLSRVGARTNDASDADAAVIEKQARYDMGEIGWRTCDAGGSYDETLRQALAIVNAPAED